MIRCIREYTSAGHAWGIGDVVTDPDLSAWLLRDARDPWEIVEQSIEDAPNRMVTRETPKTRTRKASV